MRLRTGLFILSIFFFASATYAQAGKQTEKLEQVWTGYFNQTRLGNRWGFWLDVQLRTKENFFNDFSQFLFRPGVTYYLNDATKLTAGYAFINFFPGDNHQEISQPEHRPWQQLQWHTKYRKLRTMQWIRLEERYRRKVLNDSTLAEGHNFNFRMRYNFLLQVPLTKGELRRGSWSFIANNEVHINFGKQIVYNYFDQNRFFLGAAYQLSPVNNLQIGYMNVFQQLGGGNRYRSINTGRIFYFHNLDLRSKKI